MPPVEEVPSEIPEPCVGINFARRGIVVVRICFLQFVTNYSKLSCMILL